MSAVEALRRLLSVLAEHPLLERLIVASLELIVVTAVVLLIIHVSRVRSNRVIALLWLIALGKPIVGLATGAPAPVWNVGWLGLSPAVATETAGQVEGQPRLQAVAETVEAPPTAPVDPEATHHSVDPARTAASAWLIGVAWMTLLSIVDRLRIRRLAASASAPPPDIAAMYAEAGGNATHLPRLLISDRLDSPAFAGTLFPVVFLPAWMARRPDRERIIWSLRHELAHWRHRDHIAGAVGELSRILFFFHPLVWWIGRRWKVATEIACDQALVASRWDARRYAEQLYQILARVSTRRRIVLANGLFATRTEIGKRIELLLKSRPRAGAGRRLPAAVFLALFAALVLSVGAGLTPRAEAHKRMQINVQDDDGRSISVKIEGKLSLSPDREDVVSISKGGRFEVLEERDGVERKLTVVRSADGMPEYTYEVDGKERSFDGEAREWLSEVLRDANLDNARDLVYVTRPGRRFKSSFIVGEPDSSGVKVRVVDPTRVIDVHRRIDDGAYRMILRKGIDISDISIDTSIDALGFGNDRVVIRIEPSGRFGITVTRDGKRHELEVRSSDNGEPAYTYKVDGEIRPYDENARKIFEKYLRHRGSGFEVKIKGERI
jgi:beta-lactamase regulating signal transducer with metallopeptidase domain